MHTGSVWPFDLTARVYMGAFAYPDWVRLSYTVDKELPSFWDPLTIAAPTVPPPYTVLRDDTLRSSVLQLCFAGFVESIAGLDLFVGFELTLGSDGLLETFCDQCWYDGNPQMDRFASHYIPDGLNIWSSLGVSHIPLMGAAIGLQPLAWNAIPY